nr:glutamate receptor 2.8-like [Setaria viridis]
MEKIPQTILFLLLIFSFGAAQNSTARKADEFHVGVILDLGSLVGKASQTSISLAVEDFYSVHQNYSTKLAIHIRDSMGNEVQAASAAIELLENHKVQAIIGPQKSSEAAFISKLGSIKQVPIVSFTATSPDLTYDSMPYFVRATLNDSVQVNNIVSLIKAYGWREVVLIYDDTEYGRGILAHLVDALQQIDAHVPYRSAIPLSATSENMMQELYKLMAMQTRVFIVHMSSTRASLIFTKAKEAGMMNEGFVWIITDGVANVIESLSPSVIEAMNGVIGIRFHVPKSQELDTSFLIRWNRINRQFNPNELSLDKPNIFGLWAYDTVWALAQAAEKVGVSENKNKRLQTSKNSTSLDLLAASTNGPELLKEILQNKFRGLSGNFDLTDRQLPVSPLQIINVVGRSWKHVGFWTLENGLSRKLNQNSLKTTGSASMLDLNPVIWPGESTEIPRGWEIPTSGDKLRVGVPPSAYPEFVRTSKDPVTNATRACGLSIDIFEEVVKRLPFALNYEYQAFDTIDATSSTSYNDFVHQVYLQRYDIAIGDITIIYSRTPDVDFTIPYTESGVGMIVPVKEKVNKNMWIFSRPLSKGMWFGSIVFIMYTAIVVWLLEHLNGNTHLHEEKLKCILSRLVLLVWMFVFLVLASSYTASLASMLTVQQLSPTFTDIRELQKQGGYVGFHRGSYIEGLLVDIGFDRSKMRPYAPDELHIALSKGGQNGGVAALVLDVPYIKLFLAKYCKGYTMVGPIYKSAGFAFALPKRSPLLAEISKAIINITGGDTIIQIEKKWIDQNSCLNEDKIDGSGSAITFDSFGGLFLLTGFVTTCSIPVAFLMNHYKKDQQKVLTKLEDPNKQRYGQQGENGLIQDGDQGNEENGGCNNIDNQETIWLPGPNTNGDLPRDCTLNNRVTAKANFGSQVVHMGGEPNMSKGCSSLASELNETGGVDVTLKVPGDCLADVGSNN